jgi:hypothetical protein
VPLTAHIQNTENRPATTKYRGSTVVEQEVTGGGSVA